MICTEGGGEYANVDLYCKLTWVLRQKRGSEPGVERQGSEHTGRSCVWRAAYYNPIAFRCCSGDAVECAAYILNRISTKCDCKVRVPGGSSDEDAADMCELSLLARSAQLNGALAGNSLAQWAQVRFIIDRSKKTKGNRVFNKRRTGHVQISCAKHWNTQRKKISFSALSSTKTRLPRQTHRVSSCCA